MKLGKALAAIVCLSMTASFAFGGGNPKCPACKMELASKKSKSNSKAVKIGKKTFYCCSGCKMSAPAKKK